ncbi:hypothetical protein ACFQYP_13200 [Nonomuraea antimicrobica]
MVMASVAMSISITSCESRSAPYTFLPLSATDRATAPDRPLIVSMSAPSLLVTTIRSSAATKILPLCPTTSPPLSAATPRSVTVSTAEAAGA